MAIQKEVLNDFKESHEKVRKLLEDSKNDPSNEPYLSKYAARAILVHMRHSLKCLLEKNLQGDIDLKSMLGAVLVNIGVINMETEETSEADKVLKEAVELLETSRLDPAFVISLITAYNHLGVLWSSRDDSENTKKYLFSSKNLYHEFKQTEKAPLCINQLFDKEEKDTGAESLEKAHTLTLYYLAQLYGTLKDNMRSAIYCHVTLKRQLEYGDYEAIDWALNAATLSQFFAEQDGFVQARHHLAASSTILDKHKVMLLAEESQSEEHDARVEVWKHRSADVARCWAKYCLMLLTASKSRLLAESDKQPNITDLSNLTIDDDDGTGLIASMSDLFFPNIDVLEFEEKIAANYLLTFEDARKVFLECQSWLNKAKEYYKLNTLASDYIEIVQDHSQAYSNLIFFEEDDDRQAKMHKKRINMLEELLKEINPTYYMQYCRQLWYELGETYTDILNIKLDRLKNIKERPTPQMLNKINLLAESSITNFELFLSSIKDTKTGSLPVKLEQDVIRPVITAHALVARNHMKIITPEKKMQLKNCIHSLEAYHTVVDYCKRDEDAAAMMSEEFALCQEMVNILPLKIKKLESEAASI